MVSRDAAEPRLRADARQNREKILAAARSAMAASADASLNAIAKAAGVGPGTLYRHFPTREALVLAVYADEIARLAALASALLDAHMPFDALRLWFGRLARDEAIRQGLAEILLAPTTRDALRAACGPLLTAVDRLLRATEASGRIRTGITAEDMLMLMGALWRIDADGARAARLLDLVIDGLRARADPAKATGWKRN